MKKLYLVDVSSLFFRAYYAVRPLTSPKGLPVNAIFGFLSMIVKLLKEQKPDYLVFCYDRKEPSFRKEIYSEYKANRTEMPEDLALQIPYIKKLADFLGIPSFEKASYEADDLIGTLALYGLRQQCDVIIVSGDKDFAQMVQPGISLYDTMKETRLDEKGVFEKWGIWPRQMVDYLSIVGDSSDNIPGVEGIGPKGAQKLLTDFESLNGIYENIDQISSESIRNKLLKSKDRALLAKKLVQIVTDIELNLNLEDFKIQSLKKEALRGLLQELNFKTFERTLLSQDHIQDFVQEPAQNSAQNSVPSQQPPLVETILTEKTCSVGEFAESLLPSQDLWGFKSEVGFYFSDQKSIFHLSGDLQALGGVTDTKMIQWKGFDLKDIWGAIGCQTPMGSFDGMLAAYVLKGGDSTRLSQVVSDTLGAELLDLTSPQKIFSCLFELETRLEQGLQNKSLWPIYQDFELPLTPVLLRMEKRGIKIDVKFLREFEVELKGEIERVEKGIIAIAEEDFNVASPKQLAVVLFEKLKLPTGKRTKTGFSTDNDVLEGLDHPIAKEVLEFRELSKLKSTYVDALLQFAEKGQDRIHTHFKQALTATGRLSSVNPNLQNIPVRTARGQKIRKAFIAESGHLLLSADYSQIELRILAHISEDPGLISAFQNDLDIHTATAAEIFSVDLKEVTSVQRRAAKAVNFGIAYGQGVFGLSENLGISRSEAQGIIQRYFERFKGVQAYIESTTKQAHQDGYVETLFGRRRTIEELHSKSAAIRKFGERAAINAPIQGTASDLVKKAMIEIERQVPVPMLLQVHDELIFEDSESRLQQYVGEIKAIMEGVTVLKVPLKVNTKIAINWDEAH
jgi:DNA polymerase-1